MTLVGLVMHRERAPELATATVEWLLERGHEVRLAAAEADQLRLPELGVDEPDLSIGLDLMLSLGGGPGDCDDQCSSCNPGSAERCDDADNDCDGSAHI